MKELLQQGADPNILGRRLDTHIEVYPIYISVTNKFNDILRLLIEHNAKVDVVSPGFGTALHGAITFSNQEAVEILLEGGAEYSDSDSGILDALLLMDADVNLKTSLGTALDSALRQGQFKTARVLLNAGADPDLIEDHLHYRLKDVPD